MTGAVTVSQLVLSLYLLTQSHIKLYYASKSATREAATREALAASLAEVLSWIEHTEKSVQFDSVDRLILKLTERKAIIYITKVLTHAISTYKRTDEIADCMRMMFMKFFHEKFVHERRHNSYSSHTDVQNIMLELLTSTIADTKGQRMQRPYRLSCRSMRVLSHRSVNR